ncbi:CNNM domain-containing protein [Anaerolineales bacterium]
MDDSSLLTLLIIFTIFNFLISLAYTALKSVRLSEMNERIDKGDSRAQKVLDLNLHPHLGITYQFLHTLSQFLIIACVTLGIISLINGSIPTVAPLAFILLSLLGVLVLVLAEMIPERIGFVYANRLSMFFVGFFNLLIKLFRPITLVLAGVNRLIGRLIGQGESDENITEDEIVSLVNVGYNSGALEDHEKEMLISVLQMSDTTVRELMVPRIDIEAIEINDSIRQALDLFNESGYSRVPVYQGSIDHIAGILYAKDLLQVWMEGETQLDRRIEPYMRDAIHVPEDKAAVEMLRELRDANIHIAIVADEYGGTAGLVTIEDIVEEIIGDIRDEYDTDEEAEYIQEGTEYLVDAGMDLDDFNELMGVMLDTNDADTIAGYIYGYLGHVPVQGEILALEKISIEVVEIEGHRIRKIRAKRNTGQTQEIPVSDPTEEITDNSDITSHI